MSVDRRSVWHFDFLNFSDKSEDNEMKKISVERELNERSQRKEEK